MTSTIEKLILPAKILTRQWYFKFSILVLLFMLLMFDPAMAQIYLLIIVGDYIWFRFDTHISYPIEKNREKRILSLIIAIITTAVFFVLSTFILRTVLGSALPESIWKMLSAATPLLADNKIFTIIGWAVLIPLIETSFFFGRIFEGLQLLASRRFKKQFDRYSFNVPLVIIMLVTASLFTVFHLTAKGLANQPLILTFIFAMVSMVLVVKTKHLRSAVLFHMFVNLLAVLAGFGLLSLIPIIGPLLGG